MELKTLKATGRVTGTKGAAHILRRDGGIPAVVYGNGKDAASLTVNGREFERLLHAAGGGAHAIVQLEFDDQPAMNTPAMVKAIQRHPLRGNVLHTDFLRIRLDERIQTAVAVVLTGQAKGVREGGLVEHQLREIEVECLALDVPAQIEVDITALDVNEVIHVSELTPPAGVTFLSEGNLPVVSIVLQRAAASETAAESAEAEAPAKEAAKE